MELYIDDANVKEIARLWSLYPFDGVTTNPSILAKAGEDPVSRLHEIRKTIGDDACLFVQAIPRDSDGMIRDARAIAETFGRNTVVKIPSIPEGFRAIRQLKEEGIRTCGTVVYTPMQAYLAAKAGAEYVAPYVNRIDNMGFDGVNVVEQIQDILTMNQMDARVLAASFKNSQQLLELCSYGVGAATCSPDVIDGLVKNAAVEEAVDQFRADFFQLTGQGKTMAELV